METEKQQQKERVLSWLSSDLNAGKKPLIYTTLRSVSRSGMSRKIDAFYFKANSDGTISKYNLNYAIAQITSFKQDSQTGALKVGGCGMDMGFHLVYSFSRCLFDGLDISKYKISGRNGLEYETTDAGYVLKQEWL